MKKLDIRNLGQYEDCDQSERMGRRDRHTSRQQTNKDTKMTYAQVKAARDAALNKEKRRLH